MLKVNEKTTVATINNTITKAKGKTNNDKIEK